MTTMATVRHWVAPKAKPASRRSLGISFNTSSEVLATVGIIKTVNAKAPAMALYAFPNCTIQTAKINNPATIDGTPLIACTKNLTSPANRPLTSTI